jgi:hypothetical protein
LGGHVARDVTCPRLHEGVHREHQRQQSPPGAPLDTRHTPETRMLGSPHAPTAKIRPT